MTATNTVPVHSSNVEQLRAWDGDEGEYWADNAEYFDRSVAVYHERLFAVAAIGEREHLPEIADGLAAAQWDLRGQVADALSADLADVEQALAVLRAAPGLAPDDGDDFLDVITELLHQLRSPRS